MDFAVAIHVVHVVPDQVTFFGEVIQALKKGRGLLFIEPKGRVSREQFAKSVAAAERVGFVSGVLPKKVGGRAAFLMKNTG